MLKINATELSVFDEKTFRSPLHKDIDRARGRIVIVSPYLTARGITAWENLLTNAIARGVRICVFLQRPKMWERRLEDILPEVERSKLNQLISAIEYLRALGVHVSFKDNHHEKLVLLDENIAWLGSLNLLSWFDTRECSVRVVSHGVSSWCVNQFELFCDECVQNPSVGTAVRAVRRGAGLSQQRAAQLADISRDSVIRIEQNYLDVGLHETLKLCKTVNLSVLAVPSEFEQTILAESLRAHRKDLSAWSDVLEDLSLSPSGTCAMSLGQVLKRRRNELGLGVVEVCTLTGLPPWTIHRAEAGRNVPFGSIARVCKVLHLSVVVLPMKRNEHEVQSIVQLQAQATAPK